MQHADHRRARRRLPHQPGGRGLAAQRVVDEAGDGGTVGRAGETMRQSPVLERICRRAPPRLDLGKNFNGGGKATRQASCGAPSLQAALHSRFLAFAPCGGALAPAVSWPRTMLAQVLGGLAQMRPRKPLGTLPFSTQSSIRRRRSSSCSSRYGLSVEIVGNFGQPLVADALDVFLHETVVVAPFDPGGAHRGLLGARRDLMRVQIVQTELVDQRLFDFFVQDEKAVGVDGAAAKFERFAACADRYRSSCRPGCSRRDRECRACGRIS